MRHAAGQGPSQAGGHGSQHIFLAAFNEVRDNVCNNFGGLLGALNQHGSGRAVPGPLAAPASRLEPAQSFHVTFPPLLARIQPLGTLAQGSGGKKPFMSWLGGDSSSSAQQQAGGFKAAKGSQQPSDFESVDPDALLPIASIEVDGADDPELREAISATLAQQNMRPNFSYTMQQLDATLLAVMRTGWFQDMRWEPQDTKDGVMLRLVVLPNPKVEAVEFLGGESVPTRVVQEVIKPMYGKTANALQMREALRKLDKWCVTVRARGRARVQWG